jgi:CRISPR-associated exonuclease Cas4
MEDNEEYLLLSGIQHFQFCKRQWALIHIEQQWEENVLTAEGRILHERVDQPNLREKRGDRIIIRAMPVKSNRLKLQGICDVVELVRDPNGIPISGLPGKYLVYPIEYKRGRPKKGEEDLVQLVAQTICLEEMFVCSIETAFFYYQEIRHRVEVRIANDMKEHVHRLAHEMHQYFNRRHTPKVKPGPHCRSCSLQHICLPEIMSKRPVKSYIEGKLAE